MAEIVNRGRLRFGLLRGARTRPASIQGRLRLLFVAQGDSIHGIRFNNLPVLHGLRHRLPRAVELVGDAAAFNFLCVMV